MVQLQNPRMTVLMLSANPFSIISVLYATSVPRYLKTWPKWFPLCLLTMPNPFYSVPLRRASPNSKKHRITLHALSPVPLDPAVHTAPVAPHLSACQPASLRSALHACHSTRSLRVSNTNLLRDPFIRSLFGVRNFSFTQPLKSGTLFL